MFPTWLPEAIVVPDPGQSEADSAIANVQPDRIYRYDRAYSSFALLRAHDEPSDPVTDEAPEVKSHFVVRYKRAGGNSLALNEVESSVLTDEDRAEGITSDRVGYFTSDSACQAGVSRLLLREVVIEYEDNGEPKTVN